MAKIRRESVRNQPRRPTEWVAVAELGGEVEVRGMTMSERFALRKTDAESASGGIDIPGVLAAHVFDADGVALFDRDQWDVWAGHSERAAVDLFLAVMRLSGLGEGVTVQMEKDSATTRSVA